MLAMALERFHHFYGPELEVECPVGSGRMLDLQQVARELSSRLAVDETTEWLEADGLGGFASGTSAGLRTRRYHALLLTATTPPTGRMVLVNALDAWVERAGTHGRAAAPEGRELLSRQRYWPDVVAPEQAATIESFENDPWMLARSPPLTLSVRPFLSGRDAHALHHRNPDFRFEAEIGAERVCWTPYAGLPGIASLSNGAYRSVGLRTLAPHDPRYVPRYEGDVRSRDGGYHQGTVWPWLLGPFVEAWVRVRGNGPGARRQARRRFLKPLLEHLPRAGVGHISEIADAEPPHTPRGCPFQAWSVGEALRLDLQVLVLPAAARAPERAGHGIGG